MSRRLLEIVVGAAVCAVVVLLIATGFAGGMFGGAEGYTLRARYDQADGLSVGNPVYLAGVEIGKVSEMTLASGTLKPLVTFRIAEGVRVPRDSAAMIMSDGVLGDKFVKIEPGIEQEYLQEGDRFEFIQDSVIVENLLEKIVSAADRRLGGKK